MHRASFPCLPGPRAPRRLALALCPAWLLLSVGCAQFLPSLPLATTVRAQAPAELPAPQETRPAPAPAGPAPVQTLPPPHVVAAPPAKTLPITLDTVLRMAQDQNGQVGVARARVDEAFAQWDVAKMAWLPDLWVGTSYYRHEGGIQDFQGNLDHSSFGSLFGGTEINGHFDLQQAVFQRVDAERKVWQQKGELSRLTSDNLLDATTTYVDLLAARSGEAIAAAAQKNLETLLKKAENLARVDPGVEVEVLNVRAAITAQQQTVRQMRESARRAAARLLYLLGLDPCAELVVLDRQLLPFQLVDPNAPVDQLIHQAVTNGPGVHELEGLLSVIHQAAAKSQGLGKYLPVFDVRAGEGIFGAGPGSTSNWDNRFDMALQARWNLTPLVTAQERKRAAQARMQQAHLSYQDLQRKLTMGVQEAYESVQSGRDQMPMGEEGIAKANAAYKQSLYRLENMIKGYSPSEVLMAIRSVGGAQLNYLQAVRDHDKAQLRLMVLMGLGSERCHP